MSVKCVAMMNNASGNEQGYWDKLAERGVCVCKFQARLLISASEWTEFVGEGGNGGWGE